MTFLKHFLSFVIITLFVLVPTLIYTVIGIVIAVFELPFKIYGRLRGWIRADVPIKVEVVNAECPESERKQDLLFVHGFPDSGALWDK